MLTVKYRTMKKQIIGTIIFVIVLINCLGSELSAQNSIDKKALKISDGSLFQAKQLFPEFSWKTTPMYYMFGDTNNLLTPEEVEFIAQRTDFLTIEKSHGLKPLGAAELGAKHEISAFKKVKPDIKALYYYNSAWAWPFTSYNKNFTSKKIDSDPLLKSYLVSNPETGELYTRGKTYGFDVLNPEFRKWWVETVTKGVKTSQSDGVFIDQMHGFFWLRENKIAVQKAMGLMMADLKKELGPDKIVIGNNAANKIAQYVFPSVDAIMFEHHKEKLLSKESLLEDWTHMLRIAQAGKMSIFRIGLEADPFIKEKPSHRETEKLTQLSKERLEYYHACYLIGAQPYAYFQYGWGWRLSTGSLVDYPEFQKPLGQPKGAYKRLTSDGWEFTREFEHASVWVDTEKGKSKIVWK